MAQAAEAVQTQVVQYTSQEPPQATPNPPLGGVRDKPMISQLSLVSIGEGLTALPRQLFDKIRANEYIDFTDLPPARGKPTSFGWATPASAATEHRGLQENHPRFSHVGTVLHDLLGSSLYAAATAASVTLSLPSANGAHMPKNSGGRRGSFTIRITDKRRQPHKTITGHKLTWPSTCSAS